MDAVLVQRFAREAGERVRGAEVRRISGGERGIVLALESQGRESELGIFALSGAAWIVHQERDARRALLAELAAVGSDLVSPCPALGWRAPETNALDALRAWLLQPAPSATAFGRLERARCTDLAAIPGDRLLRLEFAATDAVGTRTVLELACELADSRANLRLHSGGAEIANWRGRPPLRARPHPGDEPQPPALAWSAERGLHPAAESQEGGLTLAAAAHLDLARCAANELRAAGARALRRAHARAAALEANLEAESREAEAADEHRATAELLAANLHRVARGQSRVTVEDFYAGGAPRTLELDPTLTPQENLARLFKRARRASRGRDVVAGRLAAARAELESLAERQRAADTARSFGEIVTAASIDWGEAARTPTARLWAPGGLAMGSVRRARGAPPAARPGPGRRFLLDGGFEVRVGRSNAENDELTHRFARPDDIWLHASGVSGSHVVLRMPERGDNPPREVLEQAAAIAARFSKAKHAGTVPVLWTRKRYVRKPRGAAPGLAVCTHEKTVFVRPGLPDGQGD